MFATAGRLVRAPQRRTPDRRCAVVGPPVVVAAIDQLPVLPPRLLVKLQVGEVGRQVVAQARIAGKELQPLTVGGDRPSVAAPGGAVNLALHEVALLDGQSPGVLQGAARLPAGEAVVTQVCVQVAEIGEGEGELGIDGCAFNIEYTMANAGDGPAIPSFWNRLRAGADLVTQQSGLILAPESERTIATQGYLAPGRHTLILTLDDEGDVAESDETNNRRSVTVDLRES